MQLEAQFRRDCCIPLSRRVEEHHNASVLHSCNPRSGPACRLDKRRSCDHLITPSPGKFQQEIRTNVLLPPDKKWANKDCPGSHIVRWNRLKVVFYPDWTNFATNDKRWNVTLSVWRVPLLSSWVLSWLTWLYWHQAGPPWPRGGQCQTRIIWKLQIVRCVHHHLSTNLSRRLEL